MSETAEYDFKYNSHENHSSIGLCRATLQKGDNIIERKYEITQNGKLLVSTSFLYDGEKNGTNYERYRFYSEKPRKYPIDVLDSDPFGWIQANHEADPQVEFEKYEDEFEEEIEQ